MTARCSIAASQAVPPTALSLFRRHIREMRAYAAEIEVVLGKKSPIVKRILSCADSNERALNLVAEREIAKAASK